MYFKGNRRVRLLLIVAAHLVVLGMLFQVAAFDHWNQGFDDVQGVSGSSSHVHAMHCHGDVSGCADAGGGASLLDPAMQFGIPRMAFLPAGPLALESESPYEATLPAPTHPPRPA